MITVLYNDVMRRAEMEEKTTATLERIQQVAMEEFAEKGFLGASLRQIVKQAGVTTGAFYGYFSSKEALFASIVEPHAAALMGQFMKAQTSFAELPEQEQPDHMGLESSQCVHWMVDYICDHREPVKLLSILFSTLRYCAAWGVYVLHWTSNYAISLLAGCSTASLRLLSTICPRSGPCAMWINCGIFTLQAG